MSCLNNRLLLNIFGNRNVLIGLLLVLVGFMGADYMDMETHILLFKT